MDIKKILPKIKKLAELASYFLGFSFVLGFFIWNTYLYALGFKEDSVIQTRFVYTGVIFILITFLIFIFFKQIGKIVIYLWNKLPLNKKLEKIVNSFFKNPFIIGFILIIYYFVYIFFIFTSLPPILGGGKPVALSLIANTEEISYLNNFGIKKAKDSMIQTEIICIAYENADLMVIPLGDRVMQISKNEIKGYVSLPGLSNLYTKKCSSLAKFWTAKTFYFNFLKNEKIIDLEFSSGQ